MTNKNGFFLWRNGVTYRANKGDKLYRVYGRFSTGKGIGYL